MGVVDNDPQRSAKQNMKLKPKSKSVNIERSPSMPCKNRKLVTGVVT